MCHVTVDDCGHVIICDFECDTVFMLDMDTLKNQQVLLALDDNGIQSPCHVTFTRDTKHLVVCWLKYVDVYTFCSAGHPAR